MALNDDSLMRWKFEVLDGFSDADRELMGWVESLNEDDLASLLGILASRWNNEPLTDYWFGSRGDAVASGTERSTASRIVVHELRQYAGHSLNVFADKPHYPEVLTKVHARLAKRAKKKAPSAAAVRQREDAIAQLLVAEALDSLTEAEVREAIAGLDLNSSKENQRKILLDTVAAAGIQGLVRLLGKRVIKNVVLTMLERAALKKMGEKAVKEALGRIATKVPQTMFKRAAFWVGIGFLLKDVYDIGGEATRVTMPLIAHISVHRSIQRSETAAV